MGCKWLNKEKSAKKRHTPYIDLHVCMNQAMMVRSVEEDSKRYWYTREQWYTATAMRHSIMRGLPISQVSWGRLVQAWKSGERSLSLKTQAVKSCQGTDNQPIPAAYTAADCYMNRNCAMQALLQSLSTFSSLTFGEL